MEPDALLELPASPMKLGEAGLARWQEAGTWLVRRRILTTLDLVALALHCGSFDQLADVRRDIDEHGMYLTDPSTGRPTLNPAVEILQETKTEIRESAKCLMLDDPFYR